ncbi:MAG: hypothetical protein NDJ94_12615 [Vicinamibacteria bacterium]|nr:hypothetical protein [Vicinamibacteria bacterium]
MPSSARRRRPVLKVTLFQIKVVHTAIFFLLSGCVLFIVHSGLGNRISSLTWVAIGLVLLESVVLALSGWQCPLTLLAERLGAKQPGVADLFLPQWLADRIFPVCGTTFVLASALVVYRVLSGGAE